jgi:deoxyribodipyrimidine photo-lyase
VVSVVTPIPNTFDSMSLRQYSFQVAGLKEFESHAVASNVPFYAPVGNPEATVIDMINELKPIAVVTDHFPLRTVRAWHKAIAAHLDTTSTPLVQVDASNIVPVWVASDKQEVGARTLRPKIHKQYGEWLVEYPELPEPQDATLCATLPKRVDWDDVLATVTTTVERTTPLNDVIPPGYTAGMAHFNNFLESRLRVYATMRNDPNVDAQSGISPYIRFGQISFQRLALEVKKYRKHSEGTAAFIEEGVVRRELSDNYCFYNENYDNLDGAAGWARESLNLHNSDKREYVYTREQFEKGETADDLWNAAQIQLVTTGRMHGFMRMYWAKKILEWTNNAAEALEFGLYFNDKYAMDGSCPNGYVGLAWSIMGIHDMGWKEREVFGKIRFMNYNGCKRKFNIQNYVAKFPPASANAANAGGGGAAKEVAKATKKSSSKGGGEEGVKAAKKQKVVKEE